MAEKIHESLKSQLALLSVQLFVFTIVYEFIEFCSEICILGAEYLWI